MQINITGHGIQVTPPIRSYTEEKFNKLTKKDSHIMSVNVILDVDKLQQIAKATLHTSGIEFYAKSESENLYSAIDLLVDKLEHQVTKHKEKIKDHHRE